MSLHCNGIFLLLSPNGNSGSWTRTLNLRIMKQLLYLYAITKYAQTNDFKFISKLTCNKQQFVLW
jgi:hypothetical protein